MKVLSVVGARPQFVKAAAVSRVLRAHHHEVLVHTGQHYDDALSGVFFRQLGLPTPDRHLGIGSGSHGRQTAAMLIGLEEAIADERPDWVLIYGDTNSTLAGALAAAKLTVPLAHVEAGLRSMNRTMPEEHNRVVADHLADLLLCPTDTAMAHLAREGLAPRSVLVGDVMVDILRLSLPIAEWRGWLREQGSGFEGLLELRADEYALATIHRAGNTDHAEPLRRIMGALGALAMPVLLPAHPRLRAALAQHRIGVPPRVHLVPPAPYLAMLALQRDARVVLTDSGGVQKEAYLLGVPCVTMRDETEWPETLEGGWNVLAGTGVAAIVEAAHRTRPAGVTGAPFGDGHAASAVVRALERGAVLDRTAP